MTPNPAGVTRAAMAEMTDEQLHSRVAAVVRPGGEHVSSEGGPMADCIVIDAPCSGTGTLRRNPEHRGRVDEAARLAGLCALQVRDVGGPTRSMPLNCVALTP